MLGPADNLPSGECTSRAGLLVELSASHRERSLSGPLLTLLELLAEESQGAAPAGEDMPEPVAPGDVASSIVPRIFFAPADAKVEAGSNEALMAEITTSTDATAEEERTPSAEEGGHEAPAVEEGGKRRPRLWRGATRLCALLSGPCAPCAFAA